MRILPASQAGVPDEELSRVFVEGFYPLLRMLCKDKARLAKALAHALRRECFFVVFDEENNRAAAILARTDGKTSSLRTDRRELRRHLGPLRGELAWRVMHPEVDFPKYPFPMEGMCALENLAVDSVYRGQGLARLLMTHAIETAPEEVCVLEVADSNEVARPFYERLGFREAARLPQKWSRFTGVKENLYLRLEVKALVKSAAKA